MIGDAATRETSARTYPAEPVDPLIRLARVPREIPRVDVAIAVALFVWAALEAVFAEGNGSTAVRLLFAALMTLPLALRRRWPLPVLTTIAATAILSGLVGDVPEEGATPMPSLMIAAFSAALYTQPRWLAWAAIPMPIAAIVMRHGSQEMTLGDVAILTFIVTGSWLAGWMVRQRAEQLQRARAAAPEIAREAVTEERARMARELHDVVAHSVSIISVQAGAAEQQMDSDPEQARVHLDHVRRGAHEALVELRRLVGILRENDADYVPQPSLARLEDLIGTMRDNGMNVEIEERGEKFTLPVGVDLAAYRLVQESLTNVHRHAGGADARVVVGYERDELTIEVHNEPIAVNPAGDSDDRPAGGGHGLIGMRERVRIYGGSFSAGPVESGGWLVRATLPVEVLPE